MKIRNGFVSNSSSSSFCIIGVYFDDAKDALDKLSIEVETKETDCECALDCDKLRPEGANFCPSCGSKLFKETTEYDMREQLRTACAALKIGVILDEWGICVGSYIGSEDGENAEKEVESMQNANKRLKELFGDDADIRVYTGEECY